MDNYIIKETFTLPSKGMIYDTPIDPKVTIRSMTTMDELRRLSPNDNEYQSLCNLIEDCIVGNLGMKVYDLCLGDFTFLLHKLRIVSYGPEYNVVTECPRCHSMEEQVFDLETLDVLEYKEEEVKPLLNITLPRTKKDVKLRYTTPRMLDEVEERRREYLKKDPKALDPQFILTIESLIDTVDGRKYSEKEMRDFVENLPIMDSNYIIQKADQLNRKVGLDTTMINECAQCGYIYPAPFRFQSEFFRPTFD